MGRIIAAITGNPWLLLWLFLAGVGIGAGSAWQIQGWRLDAVKAEYKGFVASVEAEGKAAQKIADAKALEDKRNRDRSDNEYKLQIASLTADNQRLRNDRARGSYVPAAPAGSSSPSLACFDRVELERTLQRFDQGTAELLNEGDAAAIGLNVARRWAAGIAGGTSPGSPARASP